MPRICLMVLGVLLIQPMGWSTTVVDFETLGAGLSPDSAYVGADAAGGFSENGASFNNNYDPTFQSWNGFAYSNRTSHASGGFAEFNDDNDTTSEPRAGVGGSSTWAVANSFSPNTAVMEAPSGMFFDSLWVTNTATAAFILEFGNGFSDPFGGPTGDEPDLFTVRFNDLTPGGGGFVEHILADYRFADPANDFIVEDWQQVDLTSLGEATRIGIEFTSTDVGSFGINTPTYVAIDDIQFEAARVPEPGSLGVLALLGGAVVWYRRRKK